MDWVISEKKDFTDIRNFLLENEWQHIQAASLYTGNYPSRQEVITLIKRRNGVISSLISLTSRGMVYPIFSPEERFNTVDKEELIKLIARINIRIHGVIGLKDDVEFIDSIIFRRIRGIIDYFIMHRCSNNFLKIREQGDFKATTADLDKLLPLEYQYQIEEVLLNPKDLNKDAIKEHFRLKLKTTDTYACKVKSSIVSKASTTQKSFNYTLIGGVFTWKDLRNRGYSTNLLKFLINDQLKSGFKSALFVKQQNLTALHIYKKLGFTDSRPFKIHYYFL